ncbi:MAG: CopG family transcriptional regulator [Firmicutes bacterium]|nr:CopG family transcriptional regulator [Bacillota bacterium]
MDKEPGGTGDVTTNIRLPAEMHSRLRHEAACEGRSMADLIREAVGRYLVDKSSLPRSTEADDPFFSVIGIGEGSEPDSAEQHDYYIYGSPRKAASGLPPQEVDKA